MNEPTTPTPEAADIDPRAPSVEIRSGDNEIVGTAETLLVAARVYGPAGELPTETRTTVFASSWDDIYMSLASIIATIVRHDDTPDQYSIEVIRTAVALGWAMGLGEHSQPEGAPADGESPAEDEAV